MRPIDKTQIVSYLKTLANEILNAAIHYRLYKDLNQSIPEYQDVMNVTPTFWNLTLNSHLTAARSALYRAYDFAAEGTNLPRLLAHIEDHVSIDPKEIEQDRRLVARDEPLIERNRWQRNNQFAHLNFENTQNQTVTQAKSITYGELETLIDRAFNILNKYSQYIRKGEWERQIVSHDDYKHVLAAIKRDWAEQTSIEEKEHP